MKPVKPEPDLSLHVDAFPPDQALARLLDFAAQKQASDLLFATDEHAVTVSMRHLGIQRFVTRLTVEFGRRCLGHIKAVASMDFVEHRKPQDGRWVHQGSEQRVLDVRVSVLPTLHGEDFNLRLLNRQTQFVELERLGMVPAVLQQFQEVLRSPSGLVLVTGPTGAGKTTTLYAALQDINQGHRKINTVEDPIEYTLPGIRQSQINPHLDLGFPDLLAPCCARLPMSS